MTDLFSWQEDSLLKSPLAARMRPDDLADFEGHLEWLAPGKPLRNWIERDQVPSMIFWGPPGSGKTTLANIVSKLTNANFEKMSAITGGVKNIHAVAEGAIQRRALSGTKTTLFVDEIHRFTRTQQEALLPYVESGVLTLIGATTENPSFSLVPALLSRTRVLRLNSHSQESLRNILKRALQNTERGYGGTFALEDEGIDLLARLADGDARRALNSLEIILKEPHSSRSITRADVEKILEATGSDQPLRYDRAGEEHYNLISALIKSMRASDSNAAVYYLARMIEGGEDPVFVARRLIVFASEDIGNRWPGAITLAVSTLHAVQAIGLPECRINLSQAVIYLANAPKSREAYEAIETAISKVREFGALPVPMHLRNAPTGLMKAMGYGKREKGSTGNLPDPLNESTSTVSGTNELGQPSDHPLV